MSASRGLPAARGDPELHYLDSAATSQKPRAVLDAMMQYYKHDNANPHRGAYALSARATDRYHDARERIARFLGVRDAARLIFTRGTTEALNLVATAWGRANVRRRRRDRRHGARAPRELRPVAAARARRRARRLRICPLTPDGRVDLDAARARSSAPRTKVVAFNHVSNALGTINPVREIERDRARASARIVVCDGAQAAPHLPLDFDALDVDFYAFSGHKMLGPMGMRRARRPPRAARGDAAVSVRRRHDRVSSATSARTWNVLPHKFEAGTPNVARRRRSRRGVRVSRRARHGQPCARTSGQLIALATERLSAIEDVRIYGPPPAERSGVVSFTVGDIHPHDLATILDEGGVCIRAGHHCAQPLMRRLDRAGDGARVVLRLQRRGRRRRARRRSPSRTRGFRLMYAIAIIRYRRPLEEVLEVLEQHRAYLRSQG